MVSEYDASRTSDLRVDILWRARNQPLNAPTLWVFGVAMKETDVDSETNSFTKRDQYDDHVP